MVTTTTPGRRGSDRRALPPRASAPTRTSGAWRWARRSAGPPAASSGSAPAAARSRSRSSRRSSSELTTSGRAEGVREEDTPRAHQGAGRQCQIGRRTVDDPNGCGRRATPTRELRLHLQSCLVTRAAAFFDLDKTVIAKSSALAFGRPFFHGGLINRRAVLKTAYAQLVFSLAGADAQQMERLRAQLTTHGHRLGRGDGPRHRPRDAARDRRPAGLRRGRRPDRGAPRRRAGDRHRLQQRGGDGRADRRDARRRPGRRHPDGHRRRPLHRRDRLLRLRREQGRGHAPRSPPRAATTSPTATPTATRSPTCRCSPRSATRPR